MVKVIPLFFGLLALVTCDKSSDDISQNCEEIACTNEFVTLTVNLENKAGDPVELTTFTVKDLNTNENITPKLTDNLSEKGTYPLYSDLLIASTRNSSTMIVFKGYIGTTPVISEYYEVTADCCHVSLVSGKKTLVINL